MSEGDAFQARATAAAQSNPQAVSSKAGVPIANLSCGRKMTVREKIVQSLGALGHDITTHDVFRIINGLADAPSRFRSSDLVRYVCERGERLPYQTAQEVLNRLFQRWRKLGLMRFDAGYWKLWPHAWDEMQLAVSTAQGILLREDPKGLRPKASGPVGPADAPTPSQQGSST